MANLLCPICCDILNQPIELACGSLVCALCCCRWIELSSKTSCPGCYTHELDNLTISLPSAVVYELLGALKLVCSTCNQKDHQRFVSAGANLKQAKEFNNVIGEVFFPIPLEKVQYIHHCIGITLNNSLLAGLHMSSIACSTCWRGHARTLT